MPTYEGAADTKATSNTTNRSRDVEFTGEFLIASGILARSDYQLVSDSAVLFYRGRLHQNAPHNNHRCGRALTILVCLLGGLALCLWIVHPAGPYFRGAWPSAGLAQARPTRAAGTASPVPVDINENLTPDGEYTLRLECEVTPPGGANAVTVEFDVVQGTQRWSRAVSQSVAPGAAKVRVATEFTEPELVAGFPKAEARLQP